MKNLYLMLCFIFSITAHAADADSSAKQVQDAIEINDNTLWPKPQQPIAVNSSDSAALKVVQGFFTAYGSGDLQEIRKYVADDVQWHIPRRHPLAGTKRGVKEFTEFFSILGKAGFKAQVMILAANDTYVIDAHRGFSHVDGENIDINWVLLYQIDNGKIKRVQNFSGDLYASDSFFNNFHQTLGE